MKAENFSGPVFPRFQGTVQGKLKRYQEWLPQHTALLPPKEEDHPADRFVLIAKNKGKRPPLLTLKEPGLPAFVVWDDRGFAAPSTTKAKHTSPVYGFFADDMAFINRFEITAQSADRSLPLSLDKKSLTPDSASYHYRVGQQPDVAISRLERMRQNTLSEEIAVENMGSKPVQLNITVGAQHLDLFEARWRPEDLAKSPLHRTAPAISHSRQHATLTTFVSRKGSTLPENKIQTDIYVTASHPEQVALTPLKTGNEITVSLTVGPGSRETLRLFVRPHNLLRTLSTAAPTSFDEVRWNQTLAQADFKGRLNPTPAMGKIWNTAISDIKQLLIPIVVGSRTCYVPSAGSPHFIALFGRDSLITARQLLPVQPALAKDTLRVLAHFQGKQVNPFTEEEPGKILHELRHGELSRLGVSPHSPYYGTVDATPLYVMLLGETVKRTADTALLNELWPNLEAALEWLNGKVVQAPDNPLYGFLAQRFGNPGENEGPGGLKNIGWKDSGTSMRHLLKDGRLHDPQYPLALAEVQAYLYGAWQAAASLYRIKAEDSAEAEKTRYLALAERYTEKAQGLKKRFNDKFWMPECQFMATALQANGEQLPSISSNGAQSLSTGIVDEAKARLMIPRLMAPDMLSGWGIRTLSKNEPAYDDCSYHNGSIWPHDNWLIASRLKEYGYPKAAAAIINQVLDAAKTYPNGRLPELYTGFQREKGDKRIVDYAETCIPQAWASGTPIGMVTTLLGLDIDARAKQVTLNQPMLPKGVHRMTLRNLQITPTESVDLQIEQTGKGVLAKQVGGSPQITLNVRRG